MAILDDLILPATLTAFVRQVPIPSTLSLNQFLPDRLIPDFELNIDVVTRTNRMARFRTYDTETAIGRRDSFSRSTVTMPPLGMKNVIGEYERLMLERIRSGGTATSSLIAAIYDDATLLTNSVRYRMEAARGQVLTTGALTIAGEGGLFLNADFSLDPSHKVTAATPWATTASSTPLTDLYNWATTYTFDSGEPPAYALMDRLTYTNLRNSHEVRTVLSTLVGLPDSVSGDQLNQVLASRDLPQIVQYNSRFDDGTGTGTIVRPIPDNMVCLLPETASDLGYTAWGVTAEALELAGGSSNFFTFEQAAGLTGVVIKVGEPVRTWTKVAAIGMPVITDPRRLMVASV